MSLDQLLTTLDKVRPNGSGKWAACCPAHSDKSPSLAIKELPGGRILLHCFAGCSTESVLAAVGLTFSDLMPERLTDHAPRERRPFSTTDVLEIIAREASIAALGALDLAKGRPLNDADAQRLAVAAGRLNHALEVIHGR